MSRDSLAEQAAAWVPPWERPPAASRPAAEDRPADDAAPAVDEPTADEAPTADQAPPVDEVPVVEEVQVPLVEGAAPAASEELVPEAGAAAVTADSDRLDDPAELHAALEAILLVVDEPVTEETLAQVLDRPVGLVVTALHALADEYTAQRRGFDLRRAAGGWRLYTRMEFAPYVERFVLDGQQLRLTQAALETLAVVAYKQPVSRSRISAIRGVNCDGVVRTLVTRGLIEDCGTEPETGARLYATTQLFLEKLGMDSVTELPPLAPFLPDDVDEVADAQP